MDSDALRNGEGDEHVTRLAILWVGSLAFRRLVNACADITGLQPE